MPTLVKKLSAKSMCGDIKKRVHSGDLKDGKIYRVWGLAAKIETGTSDHGEWLCFVGRFEAINIETGEHKASTKLFLPDVAQDLLVAPVEGLKDGETGIEFGFDIAIRVDESAATGYVYEASPLDEPNTNDPMAKLANKYSAGLPAPKAKAEPAHKSPGEEKPKGAKAPK